MPTWCFKVVLILLAAAAAARPAALVPAPHPNYALPPSGLEVNRGQAASGILFLARGQTGVAVAAQSILFSPLGVRMNLVASNPDPAVRFSDPLPGVVNSFGGADQQKWFDGPPKSVTGIPRYSVAVLSGVYPGIDVRYAIGADGRISLRLLLAAGADQRSIVFEMPQAAGISAGASGGLFVRLGPSRLDPTMTFVPPSVSGGVKASFQVQSTTRFGLAVEGQTAGAPLEIEIALPWTPGSVSADAPYITTKAGETIFAATVADAAGNDAPFPSSRWAGCGEQIGSPVACTDVGIFKFSASGELVFASYLAGRTREDARFVAGAPDGAVVVTGSTDSPDFPVTAQALQSPYAGPAAEIGAGSSLPVAGDFFVARLDAATGTLLASTYFGGPNADTIGQTALGDDGSVYFIPKWLVATKPGMPVSAGALQNACSGDPCVNGYAAHLSPGLDRLLYGTYLPGCVEASTLFSDGSLHYAGFSEAGFPVTPGAYQRTPAGGTDGIVARLNPQGTALVFGTYIGGADTDWILRMAVAPDASVWVSVSSFVQCCVNIGYRLVRFDAKGERILVDKPIDVGDLAVDRDGNLLATAGGNLTASPDAFLADSCAGIAYLKLSPTGEQLFATYLPANTWYDFQGTGPHGLPLVRIGDDRFEVIEGQSMGVYAGCIVDGASFNSYDRVSPGGIVTLFGSSMGPREGVAFQLTGGRVPTEVAGTRVLVNDEPVPILYASYSQVNAILPYSLPVRTMAKIRVESNHAAGNELGNIQVQASGPSLFRMGASQAAAALNEDGTVNSAAHPARPGSRVMLFGTGGGATVPPSFAGEVTPLELRVLEESPIVTIGNQTVMVEWAGAAPGLVAGVTQINIVLPDVTPVVEGYPRGAIPLWVRSPSNLFYPGYVTIAVSPD
jgi:uncharacterized protein (TIGR03437 family)